MARNVPYGDATIPPFPRTFRKSGCLEDLVMRFERERVDPAALAICAELQAQGHAAVLVGGAVRDLLRGLAPEDWDIATSARPEAVMNLFPGSLPTGLQYGTVTVRRDGREIEVTAFRGESGYSDGRHPDEVRFGASLEEDLARRDFTVNAVAFDPVRGILHDPFGGRRDLRRRVLRTVGEPAARFAEDGLRMLRFYRFLAVLRFRPSRETEAAMAPPLLAEISAERVQAELSKMLTAPFPELGLAGLARTGLLKVIFPELTPAIEGPTRGKTPVLAHTIATVAAIRPELRLRLAALWHDSAKPATEAEIEGDLHFYGHAERGAEMAAEALSRLRYPGELIEIVATLVRLHMFQLPIHPSEAALRRLLHKAGGADRLRDLVELRRADIVATGRSYWQAAGAWQRLRDNVEEVLAAGPVFALRDLALDGEDIMRLLGIGPGPAVGAILEALLDRVLEEPSLNDRDRLSELAREIAERPGVNGHQAMNWP